MNEEEKNLLEETKQSVASTSKNEEAAAKQPAKEVDVDALLKLHGLSSETQPKSSSKRWILLAVMTGVILLLMIGISAMLNNFNN